jgi:hypothetical protein
MDDLIKSWRIVLLILVLVALALADVDPHLGALLKGLSRHL